MIDNVVLHRNMFLLWTYRHAGCSYLWTWWSSSIGVVRFSRADEGMRHIDVMNMKQIGKDDHDDKTSSHGDGSCYGRHII